MKDITVPHIRTNKYQQFINNCCKEEGFQAVGYARKSVGEDDMRRPDQDFYKANNKKTVKPMPCCRQGVFNTFQFIIAAFIYSIC